MNVTYKNTHGRKKILCVFYGLLFLVVLCSIVIIFDIDGIPQNKSLKYNKSLRIVKL